MPLIRLLLRTSCATSCSADNQQGTFGGRVQTRFPPEPNGYLHIGHAKAICVDFGIAEEFGGVCKLRFDDTNPVTEETEYVDAIADDVRWLGFEPGEPLYASDYFEQLYQWAEHLITTGFAYVDDQDARDHLARSAAGTASPVSRARTATAASRRTWRCSAACAAGELPDGSHVLRAKADMQHENMQLRDPIMYRIRHEHHHRTGDQWVLYPTYDWAHGQSDAIEGVTHSLCSLEFDSHRALYDWYLEHLPLPGDQPRQTEFARLELTYTVTSKRKLRKLIDDGVVEGWDDPRLPTLRALRRRGYPVSAIATSASSSASPRPTAATRSSCSSGSSATSSTARAASHGRAATRSSWSSPTGRSRPRRARSNWSTTRRTRRRCPHGGVHRRSVDRGRRLQGRPAAEVLPPHARQRGAVARRVLREVHRFTTDADGNVVEVQCTYDPATRGGNAPDGRKVKATIHWVSTAHASRHPGRAVRAPVHRRGARRAHRRPVRRPQPRLQGGARRQGREPRSARPPRPGGAVRAPRLLRHDPGSQPVPPHRRPQGRVGQHPEAHQIAP
jgi:glutaminyl-tRNA synthetase